MIERGYRPTFDLSGSPTVFDFVQSRAFVRGIRGPFGSGKSVGCCAAIMAHASQQTPSADGYRRSRWAVIRNTYDELRRTTLKTWLECFPAERTGPVTYTAPITHRIRVAPGAGRPGLDLEMIFLALDKASDVRKLKSQDLTGAWVNEAIEVPKEVIDVLTGRVGRFPSVGNIAETGGVEATWAGIIMDTNACDDQNWWYRAAEEGEGLALDADELPKISGIDFSWRFFAQPPALIECKPVTAAIYEVSEPGFAPRTVPLADTFFGAGRWWTMNPAAENQRFLRRGYYAQQVSGKTLEYVQRFLQSKYVYLQAGKPYVPEYSDSLMARPLRFSPDLPLLGGMDIGGGTLKPAAVWGQRGTYGDWRVLRELSLFDMGADRFADLWRQVAAESFKGKECERVYVDPAAEKRDEVYEAVVKDHLRAKGIPAVVAPTQDPKVRRDAIGNACSRLIQVKGESLPGLMIDKTCTMLRAGLSGKWHLRQMNVSGDKRFSDQPEKNDWSHVGDALGYMLCGGGEFALMRGLDPSRAFRDSETARLKRVSFDVFGES